MEKQAKITQMAFGGVSDDRVIEAENCIRLYFSSGSQTAFQLHWISRCSGTPVREIVETLVKDYFIKEILGNEPAS